MLSIESYRPSYLGLEEHLVRILHSIIEGAPRVVVIDPITNFIAVGNRAEVKSMLTRLIDELKKRGITTLMTALSSASSPIEQSDTDLSSLMDTWLALSRHVIDGESRNELEPAAE